VCYCVVPKYVGVVIMYVPCTVGSSPCLCCSVVYRSVHVAVISCIVDGDRFYEIHDILMQQDA
jgi:hypothetical protein